MNISGISANVAALYMDSEYMRIVRELIAYGITPSGDKQIDKMKLEQVKQARRQDNIQQPEAVCKAEVSDKNREISSGDTAKSAMEEQVSQMPGATQIAEFNKYKILGLF